MQYLGKIDYVGEPNKAVMPDGIMVWTSVASDIPVTDLEARMFFGYYKFCNPGTRLGLPRIGLNFFLPMGQTFIGEVTIIYNLLDEMRVNSQDAGATIFRIDVLDAGERVSVRVSDDGEGIPNQEVRDRLFINAVTTRPGGSGTSLWLDGRRQLEKMGGDIKYYGSGIDGKGASFEMSFLKKMPK